MLVAAQRDDGLSSGVSRQTSGPTHAVVRAAAIAALVGEQAKPRGLTFRGTTPLQSQDAIDADSATKDWPEKMTAFSDAVDTFLAEQKAAVGILQWRPSRDRTGASAFWLISTRVGATDHRLHGVAYPSKPFPAFTVMVEFKWQEREFPVVRLNIDSELHTHLNHPPRPVGVAPQVDGNRFYPWHLNRKVFSPRSSKGLPYCLAERPQGLSLPSAIRKVASEAAIDIANVELPEFPPRLTLV